MGALWEGPGSAKDVRGANFEGKTGRILRFSIFALNDFWKSPRGSRERAAEQQEFQRGAQGGAPSSLWGPKGGSRQNGDPSDAHEAPARRNAEGPAEGGEATPPGDGGTDYYLKTPSTRWVRRI